jgi:hypothetical protein
MIKVIRIQHPEPQIGQTGCLTALNFFYMASSFLFWAIEQRGVLRIRFTSPALLSTVRVV